MLHLLLHYHHITNTDMVGYKIMVGSTTERILVTTTAVIIAANATAVDIIAANATTATRIAANTTTAVIIAVNATTAVIIACQSHYCCQYC